MYTNACTMCLVYASNWSSYQNAYKNNHDVSKNILKLSYKNTIIQFFINSKTVCVVKLTSMNHTCSHIVTVKINTFSG